MFPSNADVPQLATSSGPITFQRQRQRRCLSTSWSMSTPTWTMRKQLIGFPLTDQRQQQRRRRRFGRKRGCQTMFINEPLSSLMP